MIVCKQKNICHDNPQTNQQKTFLLINARSYDIPIFISDGYIIRTSSYLMGIH